VAAISARGFTSLPLDVNKIVSLTGVRRCGKTYLLYLTAKKLREKIAASQVIYINFDDDRIFPLALGDLSDLIEAYYELYPENKEETVYFFFDEIQNVEGWEKFVRRVFDTENCRIYVTGSSSKFLREEIATSLRGRTITYELFPLSFREFLAFKGVEVNIHSSRSLARIRKEFEEYLKRGGFPEVILHNEDIWRRTLAEYLDLILFRDICERYRVSNTFLMKYLIAYLMKNISTLVSVNKLFND